MTTLLVLLALLQRGSEDKSLPDFGEIQWLADEDDAVEKAEEQKKPILWYPASPDGKQAVAGAQMDRKIVLDNYMRAGPWFAKDVVDLINRKFVPLRVKASGSWARDLGVKVLDFCEPGFVVFTHDNKVLLRVDRLTTFSEDWLLRILRKTAGEEAPATARGLMQQRKFDEAEKAATTDVERGLIDLRQDKFDDAAKHFEKSRDTEARYYLGAVRHLQNRDDDGRKVWEKLAKDAPKDRWGKKASAELGRRGPFSRGFEEIGAMDDAVFVDTATDSQRKPDTAEAMSKRAVRFLLVHQRADGSWNDSNYDFGGQDSLPNVYVAITALCALALTEWKDVDPDRVKAALDRAWPYLMSEKNTNPKDVEEMIWAHTYRLLFFAAYPKKDDARKKIVEIVKKIVALQKESGAWQHEYDNPFATASVLHALKVVQGLGIEIPDDVLKKGSRALETCRNPAGLFSYDYPADGAFGPEEFTAGKMPLCELALFLHGRSTKEDLAKAVATNFKHADLLEKIRKYDNHADRFQNGGFFFWYDQHGLAEALIALGDADGRKKLLERVLSVGEIDGSWVDSHELGKTYGTAMGLLTLKRAME